MALIRNVSAGAVQNVQPAVKMLRAAFSVVAALFVGVLPAVAGNTAPAMIVPGKFNVSATGGFTYTIPIAVPPGTAGMAPALSLDYASESGDGLEGLGWSLNGLPSIGRCPRTLAQENIHGGVNYDASDRFCMEGQRLVAISGTYGADGTIYRTEIEGFSKIISHGSSGVGPAWFEVHTKAGQIMYFGYAEDTDNTSNNSRLTLSPTNLTARAWAVEKIKDTKGNFLIVKYTNDMTNGQAYPNEIDYTGNDGASLTPYASVRFVYTTRSDIVPAYQAGYLQQTTQLLTNIQTYVGASLVSNYKLAYSFATDGRQHNELTSVTQCDSGTNCLMPTTFGWQGTRSTVTISANPIGIAQGSGNSTADQGWIATGSFTGDGLTDFVTNNATSCNVFLGTQSGTSFTSAGMKTTYTYYHQGPPPPGTAWQAQQITNGLTCFGITTTRKKFLRNFALPSFFGNGLSDVALPLNIGPPLTNSDLELTLLQNSLSATLNQFYTSPYATSRIGLPPNYSYTTLSISFGDFNGDGLSDFAFWPILQQGMQNPYAFYFNNGNGTFTGALINTTSTGAADIVGTADFDGDGCDDLLLAKDPNWTSHAGIYYSCNPAVQFLAAPWGSSDILTVGDFNGDGKADVLVTKSGSSGGTLYLSSGTGMVATSFAIPSDWHNFQIETGDFNGDGKTDIALLATGVNGAYGHGHDHQIWLSTGTGFVEAATIANNNSLDNNDVPIISDFNNDGASDIWMKKTSGDTEYFPAYVPELMNSVSNGLGVTTTVTYDRLNKNAPLYQKCATAGTYNCGTAYPTQSLDGPLYVVSRVDSSNGLGACTPPSMTNCYSSTYAYGQAQADQHGRGFLGFGSMSVTDVQTGIVQTTNYDTLFPYTGLITSQTKVCPVTVCTAGAVTLNSTTNTYETVSLGTGTDGVARNFVALHESVVASTDLDGTALPTVTTTYTYDCDAGGPSICAGTSPTGFGNATYVEQDTSDGSTKLTTNTYTNDATNWFLGRLTAASVQSIVGSSNLTRQTSYTYDPATGLLTSEIVEPETNPDPTLKLETDYGYDSFGNKNGATTKGCVWVSPTSCSTTTGTASRNTSTLFDTTTYHGQFATRITNALSQYETWGYNSNFGVPTSHTGPNGLTTSWGYDTFGRKTLETRPDGNQTAIAYTYCTGLPTGESCPTNAQFDEIVTPENSSGAQNGPITITYYDGLSRQIAVDSEGFDATGSGCTSGSPCWIRVATQYDANGRVYETSRPYFLSGGTPKCSVNTFDTIGRVIKVTFPDSSKTTFGFDGLTTTVTNDKGQTTTTVKNAQGLNASVTDANGKAVTYVYDAFGDLTTVTDPNSNVTSNQFDIRGRKIIADDPDMGGWTYLYDGFGELYQQVDAKSQTVSLTYDALGRVLTRAEPDLTSSWTYDTATGAGVGQIASATTGSSYTRTYVYDSLGRPSSITLTTDGTANTYGYTYESNGHLQTVAYPSGFTARYAYTTLGYNWQVSDNGGTHQVFWTANTRDAELHLTTQTAGNTVVTTQNFDPNTGRIIATLAGVSNSIANQTYTYDTLGNLTNRTWLGMTGSYAENACYDNLNRLTGTLVTGGAGCSGTGEVDIAYDALGNITSKSDVCSATNCFSYGSGAGPHVLTGITGTYNGITNPTFSYDANGNMVAGAGRTVTSTSFNMASLVTDGSNTAALSYDTEHARYKQVATGANAGTTYYLNDPVSGVMEESFTDPSSVQTWRDYIMADGHMVAERTNTSGTIALMYFTLDHLGSISVITDATGAMLERDSYDAWGKRRNPDGTPDTSCSIASSTTRGFTGQEMMASTCLINFNARIYDPSLGRFMSADPVVQDTYNLQLLNRYSYTANNPLSLTDPSGNCSGIVGCFFAITTFGLADLILEPLLREFPILGDLFVVASGAICGPACAAWTAAGVAGAEGGHTGAVLKAFVFTYVEAEAFYQVGQYVDSLEGFPVHGVPTTAAQVSIPAGEAIRVGLHGLVGGLSSVANGSKFASGFLAAGFGALADEIPTGGNFEAGLAIHMVAGGIGSEIGGGKFTNGALTAAFGYLFNYTQENDALQKCQGSFQCYDDYAASRGQPDQMAGSLAEFEGGTIALATTCLTGVCEWLWEGGKWVLTNIVSNSNNLATSFRFVTGFLDPLVEAPEAVEPPALIRIEPLPNSELPEEDFEDVPSPGPAKMQQGPKPAPPKS